VDALLDQLRVNTQRDLEALRAIHDEPEKRDGAALERLTALHGIRIKQARLRWIAEACTALAFPDRERTR